MSITRIPTSLLKNPQPVRWTGTSADRTGMLPANVTASDVNFLFLEDDTQALFMLKTIGASALTWTPIAGSGLVGGITIDKVTGLQTALDTKLIASNIKAGTGVTVTANGNDVTVGGALATTDTPGVVQIASAGDITTGTATDRAVQVKQLTDGLALKLNKDFSGFAALASTDITDVTLLPMQLGTDNKKTTALDLKTYVTKEIKQASLLKGYYTTEAALVAANPAPEAGSYAIVEATDSVWVWDSDTSAWTDTKITSVVPITRQVIAGTGLSGGGALSADVTLTAVYGTTAGTACEGNDSRLSRTAVAWQGSATDFATLVPTAAQEGFLFVVTGGASDTYAKKVYVLTSASGKTFVEISSTPAVTAVTTYEGTVASGSSTITLGTAISSVYYFEVYLSGIRQSSDAFVLTNSTTITLAETLTQDIAYSVVVYPHVKA